MLKKLQKKMEQEIGKAVIKLGKKSSEKTAQKGKKEVDSVRFSFNLSRPEQAIDNAAAFLALHIYHRKDQVQQGLCDSPCLCRDQSGSC